MPPAATVVFQVAGGVVLAATIVIALTASGQRGRRGRTRTRLERAQIITLAIGGIALGLYGLTDGELANGVFTAAVFAALAVAALRRRTGESKREPIAIDEPLRTELVALLRDGRTLDAIKLTKQRTDGGLIEAKLAVDRVADDEGLEIRT